MDKYSSTKRISHYDISVITPLYNEERNIEEHFEQIKRALSKFNRSFEIIFVNDGSTDKSEQILTGIYQRHTNVTVINLYRRKGKSDALEVGIAYAAGKYLVIIDSDLQYDASDIPGMILELEKGYDLVSGKRVVRRDSKVVIFTSWAFNVIMRSLTGLNFKDFFSGLKCLRKEVIDYLSLYGDLYRFATIYAFRQKFMVREVPIRHYHRIGGTSKYTGIKRFGMAFLDVFTVLMTVTFNENVVYYIGFSGTIVLSFGTIFLSAALLFSSPQETVLTTAAGRTGVILVLLGIQALLLKKISYDFFYRHRAERIKRQSNIKNILTHENN